MVFAKASIKQLVFIHRSGTMISYKTDVLPYNFIALGTILLAVGVWRIILVDLWGIIFIVLALVLLFLHSGVAIDYRNKRIRKYIGWLHLKNGKWLDISAVKNLAVVRSNQKRNMHLLTINRTERNVCYKLFLCLPYKNIEIFSGKKEIVKHRAEKIAAALHTKIDVEEEW